MCVAVTGTITEIYDDNPGTARVEVLGNYLDADVSMLPELPAVGDRVLIHAGVCIEKVRMSEAQEIDEIYAEIIGLLANG